MFFADLCRFNRLRRLFCSNRRCFSEYGTLLFFRTGRIFRAPVSKSCNRSTAAFRFALCVLNFCEATLSTPFLSVRVAKCVSIRCFCQSERLPELATSKSSVTRVLTLLIFCPPGPPLRETLKTSSSSFINMSRVISIIAFTYILSGFPCHANLHESLKIIKNFPFCLVLEREEHISLIS